MIFSRSKEPLNVTAKIMFVIFIASIITTVKTMTIPIPPTSSSSSNLLFSTTTEMNTLDYNMVSKTTWKHHIKSILNKESRIYIAHYTRHYRSRLRRSYQQITDYADSGNQIAAHNESKNGNNNTISHSNRNPTPVAEGHTNSLTSFYPSTSSNALVKKSTVDTEQVVHDMDEDYTRIDISPTQHDKKQEHISTTISDSSQSNPTDYDGKLVQPPTKYHIAPTQNINTEDQKEGLNVGEIAAVSIISIILSSSIFASNLLVIIPFSRCTRIRTPSNYLLLTLSISDFIIGLIVIPLVTFTTILRYVRIFIEILFS